MRILLVFGLMAVSGCKTVPVVIPEAPVAKAAVEEVSVREALEGAWDQLNACWAEIDRVKVDLKNYREALGQCHGNLAECLNADKNK